jgi:hypothetical protein
MELEQKLATEKAAVASAKSMLEAKISEAQASKSDWQELKHQVKTDFLEAMPFVFNDSNQSDTDTFYFDIFVVGKCAASLGSML